MKALIITHKGDYNKNDFFTCALMADYAKRKLKAEVFFIRTDKPVESFKDYDIIYVVDRDKRYGKSGNVYYIDRVSYEDEPAFVKVWTKNIFKDNLILLDFNLMNYLSKYDYYGIIELGLVSNSEHNIAKLFDIAKLNFIFEVLVKLTNFDKEEIILSANQLARIGFIINQIINERLKEEKLISKGIFTTENNIIFFISETKFPYPELILNKPVDIVITKTKNKLRVLFNNRNLYIDINDFKELFNGFEIISIYPYVVYLSSKTKIKELIKTLSERVKERKPASVWNIVIMH